MNALAHPRVSFNQVGKRFSVADGELEAIRDFNLIYCPERYVARLQWFDGQQRFFTQAHTVLVFSVAEQTWVDTGSIPVQALGRYDCLRLDDNAGVMEIATDGRCCVIELTAI